MVNIEICRKTGKRSITPEKQTENIDLILDTLATIIVDWGISTGAIDKVMQQTKVS